MKKLSLIVIALCCGSLLFNHYACCHEDHWESCIVQEKWCESCFLYSSYFVKVQCPHGYIWIIQETWRHEWAALNVGDGIYTFTGHHPEAKE